MLSLVVDLGVCCPDHPSVVRDTLLVLAERLQQDLDGAHLRWGRHVPGEQFPGSLAVWVHIQVGIHLGSQVPEHALALVALKHLALEPPAFARDAVTKLVETDSVMFLDDMEAVTGESRRFKREVFQCNESKRVLRYLTAEVNAYLDVDPDGQRSRELFAGNVPPPPEMSSIEVLLETLSEYEQSVSYNTRMIRAANTKINHKREHQLVLEKCSTVLEQVTAPLDGPPSMSQGVQLDSFSKEPVDTESQSLLESGLFHSKLVMHECGIISTEKEERFKQVLFRTCRSNVVTKTIPIDEKLLDYVTGEPVSKVAFIIFVTAEKMLDKVKSICHAFGAKSYECNRMTPEERYELMLRKGLNQSDIDDQRNAVRMTEHQNAEDFWKIVHSIDHWKECIQQNSVIYHHLNKFRLVTSDGVAGQYMAVHAWIPAARESEISQAFGTGRDGKFIMEEKPNANADIPTYFPVDKATGAFQGIVNAYGVARYQEINPGLFAIVFFPFLFAVMFGDILHGSFLFCFAFYCIWNEESLKNLDNELFKMPFQGRYLILLMSIMSVYMGFIYNEFASVPFDIFGSAWPKEQTDPKVYTLVNHGGGPYPFGLDPAWRWAEANIQFTNSLKMKMSIILGVSQMTLGVILKALNQVYWMQPQNQPNRDKRKTAHIVLIHESIPELTFFMFTFGYLVILIFTKWNTNWNTAPESETIQYPRGPPQIINTLIDFAMMKPVLHENVLLFASTCADGPGGVCTGQTALQRFLFIGAVICVPWLLLAKPFLLQKHYERKGGEHAILGGAVYQPVRNEDESVFGALGEKGDGDDDDDKGDAAEEFDMTEVFIHQTIHTIEYVLGCISNTASYLRLWALSLAHSQLSEVFWNYILNGQKFGVGFNSTTPMLVACFFVWLAATIGVLMVMETLSAFLHALRLQWVEFQSKFYCADGILFEPATLVPEPGAEE
eukprot:TRINITY_DN17296_c0_g1_i4.p1 TRINITY_DN17296_c0_g1~~TRINITY_DN17296_c0_g1_i4.p1  ORF type:complete len:949 (+),score=235.31 TRINITY_DN17296_c0_g1_i4:2561-5407(+)